MKALPAMDKLWAPWRQQFIYNHREKPRSCLFCRVKKSRQDVKNFLIERGKLSFTMLNLYPYNNGHLMVVPYRHIGSLELLNRQEVEEIFLLIQKTTKTLGRVIKPHGYNIGMNIGKAAGAGFAGHLHLHLVPRWEGDINFMPVCSQTKVVSESLQSLYQKITDDIKSSRNRKARA